MEGATRADHRSAWWLLSGGDPESLSPYTVGWSAQSAVVVTPASPHFLKVLSGPTPSELALLQPVLITF